MKKIFSFLAAIMVAVSAMAAWDGTVTLSKTSIKSVADLEGITLTFNGATTVEYLGEEADPITLQSAMGEEIYALHAESYGSQVSVEGVVATLTGWNTEDAMLVPMPTESCKLYFEDFGAFKVDDGKIRYAEFPSIDYIAAPVAEPFAVTVSNNGVEGTLAGVEASESGVMYQFEVLAAGKKLSKGTAAPSLYIAEKPAIDFGDANLVAYEAETAYVRFMTLQQPYFTEAGTYVLTIPEGTFVDEEGTPNAETLLKWVIIENDPKTPFDINYVTMNWAGETHNPGQDVPALSYMYELNTAAEGLAAGEGHIEFKDENGTGIAVGALMGNYIQFMSFGQTGYTTPGRYTLVIPAGAIVDGEGNPCKEYTANWNVVDAPKNIVVESVVIDTMLDTSWGFNEIYYTATAKFAKLAGAVYGYCEGMHMEFNGENTGVPFTTGMFGFFELGEGDSVTVVFKDNMIAVTDDAEYEGDIRPAGSYVASFEISFMDENQWEIDGITATFTGSVVLPNLNTVELGTPSFNVDEDPFEGVITVGDLEANGLLLRLDGAKNITPDMQIKVVADLMVRVAADGEVDPGFGMTLDTVYTNEEFFGDAMFGLPEVNLNTFAQHIVERGANNAYMVVVNSIEVLSSMGVEASWTATEEDILGTFFAVVEEPAIVLGTPVFNVAAEGEKITEGWIEANGIKMELEGAENIAPDMEIRVVAELLAAVPGFGGPDPEDGGFTRPEFQVVLEAAEYVGDAMFGVPTVNFTEFAQYAIEAGAGNIYMIHVTYIAAGYDGVALAEWAEDEESEPVGCAFAVEEGLILDIELNEDNYIVTPNLNDETFAVLLINQSYFETVEEGIAAMLPNCGNNQIVSGVQESSYAGNIFFYGEGNYWLVAVPAYYDEEEEENVQCGPAFVKEVALDNNGKVVTEGIHNVNANAAANKVMRNGQLIIVRENVEYNANGARL